LAQLTQLAQLAQLVLLALPAISPGVIRRKSPPGTRWHGLPPGFE
jgi:hypothetical protein